MLRLLFILLPFALTACSQSNPVTPPANAAAGKQGAVKKASAVNPIVVELYQSQGCSSCPPANAALNAEAGRSDVIALNFSVTYWDRLGWKDTFGDPKYTQRQYDYAAALKNPNVYTPQVVINGRSDIVGNNPGELNGAIAASVPVSGGPAINHSAGKVTVGGGGGKADIWLIRYDRNVQNVAVKAGENSGRSLPHKNVVRQLVKLGNWAGKPATYAVPANQNRNFDTVILVQRPAAGPIIAAKRI
ncbi:DUF1223 domain-containing protein [Sphingorhabdus arenilitoris]|uniref:DUF1223 domain-containing protein n=1 Tax=Sphingorhabdus arenilitoris TaxID=1490041 RepID=A0ABV8RIU6_9SPHN